MRFGAATKARGFALIIVLWTLVLLSFVMTHMVTAGRTETRIAANFVANADAETQADGAGVETIFRVIDTSPSHWDVGGGPYGLRMKQAKATITIASEAGKVNPNTASQQMLAALMSAVGAQPSQAASVSRAMLDWRQSDENNKNDTERKIAQYRSARLDYAPPGAPFESLDEIQRVIGMTPDLYRRLKPNLSIYQTGDPDISVASPAVAKALRTLNLPPQPPNGDVTQIVSIVARVVTDRGGHFLRRAVVRIDPPESGTYGILAWDTEAQTN
jgi:general secretion pathway protein K